MGCSVATLSNMMSLFSLSVPEKCAFILELEIKPCGLGSRIREMEADLINKHLDYFLFLW